jgi:hypothetical protein
MALAGALGLEIYVVTLSRCVQGCPVSCVGQLSQHVNTCWRLQLYWHCQ